MSENGEMDQVPHSDAYEEPAPVHYGRGYHRLPQEDPLPVPYPQPLPSAPPPQVPSEPYPAVPSMYAPAPPIFAPQQSSSSNTNVVVVNQPSAPQTVVTHAVIPHANDHLVFTIVMLVICCIHGNWFALVCLIPALIFSLCASNANNAGNYASAKSFGNASLCCNMCVIVQYALAFIAAVVMVALFFTVGLGFLGIDAAYNN